ncbi:MAG: phosphate butyryltransferase [Deltaproteobacteria bacterium]|nr:phosphate butyryltransferase [Deltaproteobacteria bacterium]
MIGTFNDIIETAKQEAAEKRVIAPWVTREHIDILSVAAEANLIVPIMIGKGQDIEDTVKQTPLASLNYEILDEKDSVRAFTRAMQLITEHDADILMQGGLSQKEFIDSVLNGDKGLLTSKLASFVSIFQLLKRDKLILATDTFINNEPTLPEKQVILENALVLAGMLEMESPKVAALASIEQVNPAIPSTLDAAILSKMSQRRQFGDVVVEGPLDIDCALDKNAAERKGLSSGVTGNVDIYLTPDIDVGYLLAQLLVFIGKMQMIGTVMGTSVPLIVDLPFVSRDNKVVEIALAALIHQRGARHE